MNVRVNYAILARRNRNVNRRPVETSEANLQTARINRHEAAPGSNRIVAGFPAGEAAASGSSTLRAAGEQFGWNPNC
jgi:hypothetical protein